MTITNNNLQMLSCQCQSHTRKYAVPLVRTPCYDVKMMSTHELSSDIRTHICMCARAHTHTHIMAHLLLKMFNHSSFDPVIQLVNIYVSPFYNSISCKIKNKGIYISNA